MGSLLYFLCALAALICTVLLGRAWLARHQRLLPALAGVGILLFGFIWETGR
jgi:hypothetical protein